MTNAHTAALEHDLEKLTQELSSAYEELVLVYGLTDRLRPFTDLERVSSTLLRTVVKALGVRYAFIALVEGPRGAHLVGRFIATAADGRGRVDSAFDASDAGWAVKDGIAREALATGTALIVNDVELDRRFVPYPFAVRSLLTVPLKGGPEEQHGLGVLSVTDRLDGQDFTSADLKLVATLAGLGGAALENALLVTDLQRVNAELQEANRRILEQQAAMIRAEKMSSLGRMAAGVAHELRNPLTVILGRSQMTLMDTRDGRPLPPERLETALESIETQALRAERIISSLSTYARERPTDMGPVTLAEVIAQVLDLVRIQLRSGNVELLTDVPGSLPSLRGNRDQLMQVFINLIVNAVQAMPEAGGQVMVRSRQESSRLVVVTVADTGAGIRPEHLPKIFDPFFTTKPEGEGTGLGLSIIHGIVESHGGRISVDSEVGVGTTFRLEFPAASGSE